MSILWCIQCVGCVYVVCVEGGFILDKDVLLLLSLHFIHIVCTGAGSSWGDTADNRWFDDTLLCVLS